MDSGCLVSHSAETPSSADHHIELSPASVRYAGTKHSTPLCILLAVLAALFLSVSSTLTKRQEKKYHWLLLLCLRFFYTGLFTLPLAFYWRQPLFGRVTDWPLLVLRSLIGTLGTGLFFISLQLLSLSDAIVVSSMSPAFTFLFGRIFLKEQIYISDIFFMLLSLCGVVFVAQPPVLFSSSEDAVKVEEDSYPQLSSSEKRLYGSLLGLAMSIAMSSCIILIKKMKHVHFATITTFYSCVATTATFIGALSLGYIKLPSCYEDRLETFLIGFTSSLGMNCLTLSSHYGSSYLVALISSGSRVVFGFIWQISIYESLPNELSVIGAILVTLSISLLSGRNFVTHKYRDSVPSNWLLKCLRRLP